MNRSGSASYVRLFAIVVILLAAGVYIYMNYSAQGIIAAPAVLRTTLVQKFKSIEYDYNSHAGFYSNGQNPFYFYTKDGISYRNTSGELLWDDVFDMSAPVVQGRGSYIAVAELKGNQLRVYSPAGRAYTKDFDSPILGFTVNELGYSCVELQISGGYATHSFDGKGEAIESRNDVSYNVFPVATGLSPSGKRIAISFLGINSVQMESHILFAQLGGNEWGGVKKTNQIVGEVRFLGDANLVSVSDLELAAFSMSDSNTLAEGNIIELSNEIKFKGYMGNKGMVVVLGRGLPGKEAAPENTVRFYNEKLELTGEFDIPNNVTYLSVDELGAIVATGQTFYALGPKGSLLWTYNSAKEVKQMIFLGNTDTVIEAGSTEGRILKRERVKDSAGQEDEADYEAMPGESITDEPISEEPVSEEPVSEEPVEEDEQ